MGLLVIRKKSPSDTAERVHFVPWQSQGDYYRLLSVADVILDPIHYSAGSSAYDLFSLDLPVITLPGEQNVSRYTQACYRQMEFMELVAWDADAYVRLAVHVATDGGYREHIRWEISRRGCKLTARCNALPAESVFSACARATPKLNQISGVAGDSSLARW